MNKWDWFKDSFGVAVSDVRTRLIDEAWFGRDLGQTMPSRAKPSDHDHAPDLGHDIDR